MKVRVASYNLENLFTRPTAMQEGAGQTGQQAIDDHARLNAIAGKPSYTDADKAELLRLDKRYKFSSLNPPANALVYLNKVRGQLFKRTRAGVVSVVAAGVGDWTGWFELRRTDVRWPAIFNTARVVTEVNPDILLCVEVENRPALQRFNEQVLRGEFHHDFPFVMVIDGNDSRGIDVGILSRFPITGIRSHVDDQADGKLIFSRDCPEYVVQLPNGQLIVLCPNHFKSKRGGNDLDAQERRRAQGIRAAGIARTAKDQVSPFVLIGGDLNDTPESEALQPLFQDGWHDIQDHASYPVDRPGTFGTGRPSDKIDYLIMSPELRAALTGTGVERRGSYHPGTWEAFDTVTGKADEASDHHLIWADFDIGPA
ncbi:endonuclease/exonuclease/phosphatase family protein [Polaromonas sp. YR568]|uniref:endonuclease/exonuclease/phosphatase family protein n=1 Tax=Polaromonas sp. YR568 TaxID=1855301 RepID=UPI00398C02B3